MERDRDRPAVGVREEAGSRHDALNPHVLEGFVVRLASPHIQAEQDGFADAVLELVEGTRLGVTSGQ